MHGNVLLILFVFSERSSEPTLTHSISTWTDPDGGGQVVLIPTPGESQVATCFYRNTGTYPREKQLAPSGDPYGPL